MVVVRSVGGWGGGRSVYASVAILQQVGVTNHHLEKKSTPPKFFAQCSFSPVLPFGLVDQLSPQYDQCCYDHYSYSTQF